ncbi:hypothetical protein C5167_026944 [Papaver somniferum]|nr:hypothetical protein C5167_026944 [Papaver somniferum]
MGSMSLYQNERDRKDQQLSELQKKELESSSASLYNLGKTCFLNATLQCLKAVSELRLELTKYEGNPDDSDESNLVTMTARDLFSELDGSKTPVSPKKFLRLWEISIPITVRREDAEECWTRLVDTFLESLLKAENGSENPEAVKKIFGIDIVGRYQYHLMFEIYPVSLFLKQR